MAATTALDPPLPTAAASLSTPPVPSASASGSTSPHITEPHDQRIAAAESSCSVVQVGASPPNDLSTSPTSLPPARAARTAPAHEAAANALPLRSIITRSSSSNNSVVVATAVVRGVEEHEFDSPALRALKARKWKNGRELTAHVQDIALQQGKRAMVVTSGGSFKKFVCSSDTPCPWLVNAVCTRPRVRKTTPSEQEATDRMIDIDRPSVDDRGERRDAEASELAKRKYWYVSSAYLVHTNCTGMAKPTARQLKDVSVLKQAVQNDAKISSASLVEQLKSQARLLCSKSMVYKAKIDLLDELEAVDTASQAASGTSSLSSQPATEIHGFSADVVQSTQQLPSYLARLSALNPDVLHAVERDPVSNAHFGRAIVALDPHRFFSNATPLVFGVDSWKGQGTKASPLTSSQLVLLGPDANHSTVTYAVALVPEPTEMQLTWFLSKLIECGYPLQRASAVFTDGRWPVASACSRVGIQSMMQDTRYLIEDLCAMVGRQLTGYHQHQDPASFSFTSDQLSYIWAAQRAESEGEFYAALHKLEISKPTGGVAAHPLPMPGSGALAAQHLRSIDPRRWALFPHHSIFRLYGWQTTRFSTEIQESMNRPLVSSAIRELRQPCEFFKSFALTLLNETYQRNELAMQWEREQRVVSPEAERMMQEEMKLVPLYEVAMSAPHIAFVWNPREGPQLRQRRVDLHEKTCTCSTRLQFGVPCRHILSVLRKMNTLGQSFDFFDDCYRVQTFLNVFKGHHIELPLEETVQTDPTWLPPRHLMSSGGPLGTTMLDSSMVIASLEATTVSEKTGKRKRRVRNKPADERKRPMYKCRRCNVADGHNSMTCPNRRSNA